MKISIDEKDWKKAEKTLSAVNKQAIPFATRFTLNSVAFKARKNALKVIEKRMTLRNHYTKKTLSVEQVDRGQFNVNRQVSRFGSTADYMETQEIGGIKSSQGKEGVPIATTYASGEGINSRSRKKLPRKPNKLRNIQLPGRNVKAKSKKQKRFLQVKRAVETGKRYIFMRTSKNKGIFRVTGSGRINKKGRIAGVKVRMVWSVEQRSVAIPKTRWLEPSSDQAVKKMPQIYFRELGRQIRRVTR